MRRSRLFGGMVAAITVAAVLATPRAHADDGWVAVANSPNHEQQDFGYGPDQATAEANALAQCALLQRADDCRVLASSTDCVATAWDVRAAEPTLCGLRRRPGSRRFGGDRGSRTLRQRRSGALHVVAAQRAGTDPSGADPGIAFPGVRRPAVGSATAPSASGGRQITACRRASVLLICSYGGSDHP